MRVSTRFTMDRSQSPTFTRRAADAAVCVIVVLGAACEHPTAPSADLSGDWQFTFSASDEASCPGQSGLVRGCAGSGNFTFLETTPPIKATHSFRAACQSCQRAADYGVIDQPLGTVRLSEGVLEFALAACRFAAEIPTNSPQTISGTVTCTPLEPASVEVRGNWTMFRR